MELVITKILLTSTPLKNLEWLKRTQLKNMSIPRTYTHATHQNNKQFCSGCNVRSRKQNKAAKNFTLSSWSRLHLSEYFKSSSSFSVSSCKRYLDFHCLNHFRYTGQCQHYLHTCRCPFGNHRQHHRRRCRCRRGRHPS